MSDEREKPGVAKITVPPELRENFVNEPLPVAEDNPTLQAAFLKRDRVDEEAKRLERERRLAESTEEAVAPASAPPAEAAPPPSPPRQVAGAYSTDPRSEKYTPRNTEKIPAASAESLRRTDRGLGKVSAIAPPLPPIQAEPPPAPPPSSPVPPPVATETGERWASDGRQAREQIDRKALPSSTLPRDPGDGEATAVAPPKRPRRAPPIAIAAAGAIFVVLFGLLIWPRLGREQLQETGSAAASMVGSLPLPTETIAPTSAAPIVSSVAPPSASTASQEVPSSKPSSTPRAPRPSATPSEAPHIPPRPPPTPAVPPAASSAPKVKPIF